MNDVQIYRKILTLKEFNTLLFGRLLITRVFRCPNFVNCHAPLCSKYVVICGEDRFCGYWKGFRLEETYKEDSKEERFN